MTSRVLILTEDAISSKMAGPAIRAWHMAEELSLEHSVTLATTSAVCEAASERFCVEAAGEPRIAELEAWAEVVVVQGYVFSRSKALRATEKILVVDLYDPIHLETLELTAGEPEQFGEAAVAASVEVLREQARRGDFFICASEKQRNFWLGFLSSAGRVNPHTYAEDPTLRSLVDLVPFGLPAQPPVPSEQVLKGVVPGIGPDDRVVLWGGGVYDWFDPLTLIRAVDRLRRQVPGVRLFFMGVRHPNPVVEESRALRASRELAAELGLEGTHVFFNEDWVPYDLRRNYLLEADLGVSLHRDHLETAYSARTRILDYLWAGLPVVSTRGDSFASLVEAESLGATVPAGDVSAVEAALSELLCDEERRRACASRSAEVARRFSWAQVLAPLREFCREPRPAPDRRQEPSQGR